MMDQDPQFSTPLEVRTDREARGLAAVAVAGALASVGLETVELTAIAREAHWTVGAVAVVTLVVAVLSTVTWAKRTARSRRAALRCLDELSRAAADGVLASGGEMIALPPGHPWDAAVREFGRRLVTTAERLQRAEQARNALEVRMRRQAGRQQQIENILMQLPEPVVAINSFDELVLANSAALELLGLEAESATGQPVARVLSNERLFELLIDVRRRRHPSQRSGEVELTDESGNPRWFGIATRSMAGDERDGDSASAGAFALLRDISEQKTGQKRYAEFVSAVSHEMKSPLSGIKAYVELLADCEPGDSAAREEFLGVIDSQANRLQRLIDNLLNIARIEAGVVEVNKTNLSINELLAEALEIIRPAADEKRIELSAEFSPMYLAAHVDRDMLMQAAINLLSNAVKYTPDDGRVVLRSRMTDDEVEFEVEDSGVGMSEEDSVRVFEKFYRVKKDRGMAQGTGLGLPLAKHIVEDVHGGRITVESTPGEGSVFRVALPAASQLV
jgi:two-component system phosphate regulon sensor histidine kinase PhoR